MKRAKRLLALLLCVLFAAQPLNLPLLAEELQPSYVPFDTAALPSNAADGHFYFGSTNMTISENSTDVYLMRIVRTGACEDEASVDVRFTDISGSYGVNYTVGVLDEKIKPVVDENAMSITEYFLANPEGQEEIQPVSDEELYHMIEQSGGFDTVDADGNVLSSFVASDEPVTLFEGVEGSAEMPDPFAPQDITADDTDVIADLFPGTTLTVPFKAGESEKYITVKPMYSTAADGDCMIAVSLRKPSEGYAVTEDSFSTYLTITDEDDTPSAVVSFEKDAYIAESGSLAVTLTREGAVNEIAAVNLCSVEGSAETGIDFAGIDATVYFPMGIKSRTVEIPVRHTDPDDTLQFTLKLVNPVNCFTDLDEVTVSITPGEDEADLLSSSAYDEYIGERIPASDFERFGNAHVTDAGWLKFSCKGVDYDTWNGGVYHIPNPYLYDGVRINWDAFHNGWGSISYTYVNTDNGHVFYSDDNEWDEKTDDIIFGKAYNRDLWIGSLTSYFNGIQVNARSIKPILRLFEFTLKDADVLPFSGVDDITAKSYTAVQFADGMASVKSVKAVVGGSFSVAMPHTQASFLELSALQFLSDGGDVLYTLPNRSGTNAVSVTLTDELMNAVACSSLRYDKQSDGRFVGKVYIKPVFAYRDASVTVKPAAMGTFDGDLALSGSTVKTLSFHIGDRLTVNGVVGKLYEGAYVPCGVRYEKRDTENKLLPGGSGQYYYEGSPVSFLIDAPNVTLTPTFRENNNTVRVRVLKKDVDAGVFDKTAGFFAYGVTPETDGEWLIYPVSGSNVHLDQLITVNAVPKDGKKVCVWEVPAAAHPYSGNTLYFSAAHDEENNLITLSVADAAEFDMSGRLYNADKNLAAGGVSVTPVIPDEGALISAGEVYDNADTEGAFCLYGVHGAKDTVFRLLIGSGSSFTVKEVYLGTDGGDLPLGVISTAVNTLDGAYFTGVYAEQDGRPVLATDTLRLDGNRLTVYASYKDGMKYLIGGSERTEHVTGVTFYVLDSNTHTVKSVFKGEKVSDGVYCMNISRFTPDDPDKYYYGDVIYVSMTTDRVGAGLLAEDGSVPEAFASTKYPMLSTGYSIIKDSSYKPKMISFVLPVSADELMGDDDADLSDESGKKHKKYATFPFIGSIDTTVGVKSFLRTIVSSTLGGDDTVPDYGAYDDDDYYNDDPADIDPDTASTATHANFRITVSFEKLPYGGTRFKFGATATVGNNAWFKAASYNPWEAWKFKDGLGKAKPAVGNQDYNYNKMKGSSFRDMFAASFGVPKMSFSVMFGIYVDFGIIQTVDDETGEATSLLEDEFVFLGIGGYLGGNFNVEWTWLTPAPFPGYVGLVVNVGATGHIGGSRDPNAMLHYEDIEDEDGSVDINKLHFNFDLQVNASGKGYFGIGMPDLIGARVIIGFEASFAYSPYITDYYKQLEDDWGLGVNLTVGGQIDLVVTRIPVEGFSVPLYSAGFTKYYLTVRRANELLIDVNKALDALTPGTFPKSYTDMVREAADTLTDDVVNDASLDTLQKDFDDLVYLVHEYKQLITDNEYNLLYLETPYDALLTADDIRTELIGHTDSEWVAGTAADLMGAFAEDKTSMLVRDSYSQPAAKMLPLGGGKMLCVFLNDESDAGQVTRPTLVWTVYDGNSGEWTEPAVLQNDGTVDYTPNLCDVGDRILISWSSAVKPFEEYENDAALMHGMEIYAQFFDKESAKPVGDILRLTDDDFMDAKPSVIYDSESGDIAVFYLKNAAESTDVAEFITAESVVCYRLYDAKTEAFVTDYYESEYPNYTDDERKQLAERYGGQRFFSSSVGEDLPIGDLAVCRGYNGLGMLAYTVDLDGNTETTNDTELFVRIYDFRDHSVYTPIRVTNDNISQALPQLIRCDVPYTDYFKNDEGETVDGTTYLFWLENEKNVRYISLTDLIRNGVNADGTVKDSYKLFPTTIDTAIENAAEDDSMGLVNSYQALTDAFGNLYILWLQVCDDYAGENVTIPAAREIFASAKIRPYNRIETYDAETDLGGAVGSSWSAPYRLTESELYNDGIACAVNGDGVLCILHNCCEINYIGDTAEYLAANAVGTEGQQSGNPYEIGRTDLMLTTFKPVGSVEVTSMVLSDEYPEPGDTVSVTATVENKGLTTADGFKLVFAAADNNGDIVQNIATISDDTPLTVRTTREVVFDWTVPDDFDGLRLVCYAAETGYDNENFSHTTPIRRKPHYTLLLDGIEQKGDTFLAHVIVTNDGNAIAEPGDVLRVNFVGLYGDTKTLYGLDSPLLYELSVRSLDAGDTLDTILPLSIPESAFDYCGFDEIECTVYDGNEIAVSDTASGFIVLSEPMNAVIKGASLLELERGKTRKISVDVGSGYVSARADIRYTSDDTSVATVGEDGTVKAIGEGETNVRALILPFGTELTLPVVVKAEKENRNVTAKDTRTGSGSSVIGGTTGDDGDDKDEDKDEDEQPEVKEIVFEDVHEGDYFFEPVYWAVKRGITVGVSETLFAPDNIITNAEIVTFLWRAAGCPEADAKSDGEETWYTKATAWANGNGITEGIGETFDPDAIPTRAEAVTMLYRASGEKAPDKACRFKDVKKDDFFHDAVVWADETDVTYGTSETTFTPDGKCTRAEIVTFLYRMYFEKED